MNIALFHSLWTLALLVIFIGIVVWAFSRKREAAFERAARAPLEDNDAEKHPKRASRHD